MYKIFEIGQKSIDIYKMESYNRLNKAKGVLNVNNLKRERVTRDIKIKEIAREVGISPLRYIFYETNPLCMPASIARKICALMHVPLSKIFLS